MHNIFMAQNIGSGLGYGLLYNWYAITTANFTPTDWEIADTSAYNTLRADVTDPTDFSKAGGHLKTIGLDFWNTPNSILSPDFGFNLKGNGYRNISGGFVSLKTTSYNHVKDTTVQYFSCSYVNTGATISEWGDPFKKEVYGYGVRLIYTGAGTPTTLTDYDGNVYDVVLIGSQRWIVQNWKCTHLNNGTALTNVTDNTAWSNLITEGYCSYDNDNGNI